MSAISPRIMDGCDGDAAENGDRGEGQLPEGLNRGKILGGRQDEMLPAVPWSALLKTCPVIPAVPCSDLLKTCPLIECRLGEFGVDVVGRWRV